MDATGLRTSIVRRKFRTDGIFDLRHRSTSQRFGFSRGGTSRGGSRAPKTALGLRRWRDAGRVLSRSDGRSEVGQQAMSGDSMRRWRFGDMGARISGSLMVPVRRARRSRALRPTALVVVVLLVTAVAAPAVTPNALALGAGQTVDLRVLLIGGAGGAAGRPDDRGVGGRAGQSGRRVHGGGRDRNARLRDGHASRAHVFGDARAVQRRGVRREAGATSPPVSSRRSSPTSRPSGSARSTATSCPTRGASSA